MTLPPGQVWLALSAIILGWQSNAFADGNVDAGSNEYRKCSACHIIQADDGTIIRKGGRLGPNLYNVIGSQAATVDDGFKYGSSLVLAGELGLVWDQENLIAYVADPRKFLESYIGSFKIQNKMAYKMRSGSVDLFAYLESIDRRKPGSQRMNQDETVAD